MRDVCDTCDRIAELFQLPGRTDLNCSECHASIATALQMYQTLNEIERAGGDAGEVTTDLERVLNGLLRRVRYGAMESGTVTYVQ
jgi:hypothetical protein